MPRSLPETSGDEAPTVVDSSSDLGLAVPVERPPPDRLGAYELLIELAAGGMATVYLARATDERQGSRLVALKRPHRHLSSDKAFLAMLVDEARLASAIGHSNVVKVRELGFDAGMPFIVMDYVEGASLAELRRELGAIGRALDVRVATRIVHDALFGLHAAHELRDDYGRPLRIVHRDVSPHNVLIGCDGRSRITDFGIAKAEDRIQTTRTHEVKGKLAYLAPERVDRRRICTVQSDVFSMAVVLWECFAGRRLFRGDDAVDVLQEVISAPIPTLRQIGAQIPEALDDVIARALSRDLDTRYATAADLADAIERAVGPDQMGTHADVGRLVEAIFGPRIALRHEQVRSTIGNQSLSDLLGEIGLPQRERVSMADLPTGELLAELAPPAPTGRYALGTEMRAEVAKLRGRRVPWSSVAVAAGGIAAGALVTLAVLLGRSHPARVARAASPPPAVLSPAPAKQQVTPRKITVPLPFPSVRVAFDDETRDLDAPADVLSFDVPGEAGARHYVVATAADGTRAQGYVREEDGFARPDPAYAVSAPPIASAAPIPGALPSPSVQPEAPHRRSGERRPPPIGTVRDGFTKLR